MELYEKSDSKYLWYDFAVAGKRYRGSTKETNPKRAGAIAALKLARILEGNAPLPKKAPVLVAFAERFLKWVENAELEPKSKRYYNDGWRLLEQTKIMGMRLDTITNDDVELLSFPGSASNTNCASIWRRPFASPPSSTGMNRSAIILASRWRRTARFSS